MYYSLQLRKKINFTPEDYLAE